MPLSASDIPSLIESPQFAALPHPERTRIAEEALVDGSAGLAGTWDKATYQKWGEFANQVRKQVGDSETLWEKTKSVGGTAFQIGKDALGTVGTTALGLSPVVPAGDGPKSAQQAPGMIERGNIDLYKQPKVKNADGSVSTVHSFSINQDGKEYLLPTVMPDGRHLTEADAISEFQKTGKHLGVFDSAEQATRHAEQLHQDYAAGEYDKPRGELAYQIPGETLGKMLVTNIAGFGAGQIQRLTNDPTPAEKALAEVRKGIDNGAFFDHPEGLPGWLDAVNAHVQEAAKRYYGQQGGAEEWAQENSLLGSADNAALLNAYLRTRSPEAWHELEKNVLRTPLMQGIAETSRRLQQDSTLGMALKPEAQNLIQNAADPTEWIGAVKGVKAGVKAVGKGMNVLERAKALGKGMMYEQLGEQLSGNINDPNLSWEERAAIAKQAMIGSLGFAGVGAVPGAVSSIQQRFQNGKPNGAALLGNATPAANPFGGPIQAPPQPTEDGGIVPPAGPQPVPSFTDNPYGTLSQQPAGGNVLIDYGIPRTAEAQAQLEQRQHEYAQSQTAAQAQINRAGGRMPMIPDNPMGYRDILDFVNDNPLHIPVKGSEAAKSGEYDWVQQNEVPKYYRKFLASSERGHPADVLAQMAHDEGYISQPTPDALMEQIHKTIRERTQHKVEFRRQQQGLNDEERRLTNFDKAQQKASPVESTTLPLHQVMPGDEFTLAGEDVKVKHVEHDEDGTVTLVQIEDGKKFGVLNLDPQTRGAILVDEYKPLMRESEGGGGPAAPNMEPDPFMPRPQNFTSGAQEVLAMPKPGMRGPLPTDHTTGTAAAPPGGGYPAGSAPQLPQAPAPYRVQGWSGKVQTLHGIRQFLLDAVGLPKVGVGRFTQQALGIYKSKAEMIRMQAINDIPVLAHEVGHHLHYRVLTEQLNPAFAKPADSWNGRYDAELLPLGAHTSSPTYTQDQVRKEGVAEFTRLWMTNPVQAWIQAPTFAQFFEQRLDARAPQMADALRQAQAMIADYIAMPAFEKAGAQIVFDPGAEQPGRPIKEVLRMVYAQMVNTIQPALDVAHALAEKDPTQAKRAEDLVMWMENHRGGAASKASADIFNRQTNLYGAVVGPGLQTILKDLRPGENVYFSRYLALKRAAEIEARGMRSGFENGKLPAAEMRELERRFEPTRQKLQKWMRNERDLLVQSGLLDAKSAQAMDDANADYVPFYRLYEKLNNVSFGPEQSKNSGGYVDLNSGIRRMKGSDRAIIDPLQSAMKNAFMFRKLAEQNLIGVKFFDLLRDVQGHGQWGDAIAPKMQPKVTNHADIVRKLIEQGVIQDETDLPANADLTLRLFQAMTKPDTGMGEVIVFKSGKREHWEVKDPLLMNALKYADSDAVKLGNIPSWFVKIFSTPTRLLRWGATGGPWFAIPNFIRDTIQGGVLSQSQPKGGKGILNNFKGALPFWDSFKGAMDILTKGGAFEQWKQAGGEFSGMVTGTKAFTQLLEDALPKAPVAQRAMAGLGDRKAWAAGFRSALELVGAFGQFTEQATRVGEFMRAKKNGASDLAAANFSKTVSLNFARAGEVSRVINQFVPFFNASIQGLDQLVRAHADPKTRGATIMKGLMYITVPSLMCWALGKDDDEIQNLPDYRKNLFWNINLKPLAAALGMPDAGFILSIPKPFLLGAIYGTSVEKALDYSTGRDPNGASKAAKNILANTINPFDVMMSVGGIRPIIEASTNQSLFTGMDIVPQGYQNLPQEQQYNVLTSQTARMLGRFTGQSPMMIDHLLRGYFATAGKFGTDVIDYGMAKMALADIPPPPREGMMELPILNRFAGSPYAANVFVSRFYEASKDMEGKLAVLNKQAEQMTSEEQQRWFAANRDELGHYLRTVDSSTGRTGAGDIRKAQASLSEINAAMKEIQASRVMKPELKRERMMELARIRNQAAEGAYKGLFPESVKRRHW